MVMDSATIMKQLNRRYATQQFDTTKKLSDAQRDELLEATRLAPSSFWLQAWKFFIVETQDIQDALVEHSYGQEKVAQCSHLFVFARPTSINQSLLDAYMDDTAQTQNTPRENLQGFENAIKNSILQMSQEEKTVRADKQIYIALGFLLETAALLGIDAWPMEWFDPQGYDTVLGLADKGYTSVVVCPVGFRSADDDTQHRAKVRFDADTISEII